MARLFRLLRTSSSRMVSYVRRSLCYYVLACVPLTSLACKESLDTDVSAPSADGEHGHLLGNRAPDFRVREVRTSRGFVSLASLRGSVVVVDFWGTYCGPCKQSFPKLEALRAAYSAKGLHVVGISEDDVEDKDKIAAFADALGAKFTIAWDEDKSIARLYGPEVMPSSFVIDKRGIVRFVHVGFHDGDEVAMRKEVESLLQ